MVGQAFDLAAGLLILGAQGFALFLMVLGAMDIYYHIKERKKESK